MDKFWKGLIKAAQIVGKSLIWLLMGLMMGMLAVILSIVRWLFG